MSRMRWWGWGTDGHDGPLAAGAEALLRKTTGISDERAEPVALDDVRLPEISLADDVRAEFAAVVGAGNVRDDRRTRVQHAYGRSYPDLVRLRRGDGSGAPDAVLYPATPGEVAELLKVCAQQHVAVIPFGGGTSVVGGVEALRGEFSAAVSIDLGRLHKIVSTDSKALTATVQAGVYGPDLERQLGERGLTLGHFPQSYEFSTVGGWVATRSAGQASTGYGRIDEDVVGLRVATPVGDVDLRAMPATAAGPNPREIFVGSEGALGIITEATLQVRPKPKAQKFDSYFFPSFEAGAEALRMLEQHHAAPDIARISDEYETEFGLAMAPDKVRKLALGYLGLRGQHDPCLMVLGYDGSATRVRARIWETRRLLAGTSGAWMGPAPAHVWVKGRFHYPYTRDEAMTRGMLVDTLETATTWDNISVLRNAVTSALHDSLAERGTPAYVMCHISHLYPSGASLYFTYFARQEAGAELAQWGAAKTAAGDAILANGGTITHHHAVGRDHAPWIAAETGDLWLDMLRAAKAEVDPVGIMNPGKLLPGGLGLPR